MGRDRATLGFSAFACLLLAACAGQAGGSGQTTGPAAPAGQPGRAPRSAAGQPPASSGAPGAQARPPEPLPSDWPQKLVTSPGTGPALYLGGAGTAPAVGYVSQGVTVQLTGAPRGDRIPVAIDGPLEVRAWLATARLAARVQQRGRVKGAPGYVGPNDVVGVLGDAGDGLMKIRLAPPLRPDVRLPAMDAIYPSNRLGPAKVAPGQAEGPSPGTPMKLPAGQEVPVYDRPGGSVVATLPALQPPVTVVVLRDQGQWKGVRAGTGPYLVGFVSAQLTPAQAPAAKVPDPLATPASSGAVPARLQADKDQPLWRVKEGTKVVFNGQTVAVLRQAGYAREMVRHEPTGEVDVFVAVDDRVAVRGMVPADALERAQ